jgi:hypothetical protein
MSFFVCEHGSKYYPFGRLSREALHQKIASTAGEKRNIPISSFPLSTEISDLVGNDELNSLSETKENPLPLIFRDKISKNTVESYSELAHSVISEVYKLQLQSQPV